ncbi:hypothetical protein HYW21_00800 [Candidatus Woesearchaeota archaeon]|nr:hypothetical protein [Candidatus Woesearchaeota archaeon]
MHVHIYLTPDQNPPIERFLFRDEDGSLERIAADVELPGHYGTFNPPMDGHYIRDGEVIRPVDRLRNGQKAYQFPSEYVVFMKG